MIGPTGIWSVEEALPENYPHSELLCFKLIFHLFDRKSVVIDLGCGDGYYLEMFWQAGFKNIIGVDGCIVPMRPINPIIIKGDLSQPLIVGTKGQVLSLEVGEHIPQEFEQQFIDNLCNNCKSRMVISWAIEGQGGIGHVNCRNNAYIIEQIEKRGLKFNAKLSLYLRADIEMGISYFKNTLMVFDRI